MPSPLTIGRLARAAGVNVETIRYYQRVGLLAEPPRPASGYRTYPTDAVERIRFIKRAQKLGFRLQEIRELLELGEAGCRDVQRRAQRKREQIDRQIADLLALRETLDALIRTCDERDAARPCPIVESLQRKD